MAKRTRRRQRARIPVAISRRGSDLCLQCGMCCDGTLFTYAPLDDGEQVIADRLGLERRPGSKGLAIALPCTAFRDGHCSAYATVRPHVCGAYRCGPLMSYEAGHTTLEESAEIVRIMRSLVGALEDEMGLDPGTYTRAQLDAYLDEHQPREHPEEYRELLSLLDRLTYLGTCHFGYALKPVDEVRDAAPV